MSQNLSTQSRNPSPVPSEQPGGAPEPQTALLLYATISDVRYFAALLRGVNFSGRATVTMTKAGMIVAVEDARTLLGSAYVFAECFDQFVYTPASTSRASTQQTQDPGKGNNTDTNTAFEIPLSTLVECLNIFGTATTKDTEKKTRRWRRIGEDSDDDHQQEGNSHHRQREAPASNGRIDHHFGNTKLTGVRISYAGAGHPLEFVIVDPSDGATATVELTTFDAEPQLALPFDSDKTVLKVILKSSWLRDALSELDPSCDKLTIMGNPPQQQGRTQRGAQRRLRLRAVGTFGSTEMDYPNDREVLETCECENAVSFSYSFKHISKALKALQSSSKTSLRIDEDGLLSLQFLMPAPKVRANGAGDAFIEFRCLALDDGVA
ncbi:uncharacterized protein PHACADRAFT_209489 [Phanerochaete carnosa HHB-10118-sp]|uniref:Rad1-domain-containing protein n=1 Tax=Phanerochaete carnosa (strain HHB-10118-sp) TaxID=650164 RepID=K5W9V3_PHACS|nr:uncharacterized protein PHACADRAFT_209489 [Phanerochaete carnosa HHB-10118-sp]EKM55985.1 hypothetical protein PHACADRAFT_209489 [Phanerochaete carnosa HHB-10118-sp]